MELVLLSEFFKNKQYIRAVIPYIKKSYFDTKEDQIIFEESKRFLHKYRQLPTYSAIATNIENRKDINESLFTSLMTRLSSIQTFNEENDIQWLLDSTEQFCQRKAFENALIKSSEIFESTGNRYKAKEVLDEAVKVAFDNTVGIEYFNPEDVKRRHELYNKKNLKYKTHLDQLNNLTDGGFEPKALHVFLGDTHVGKTMTLSSLGAGFVDNGYDTLYITLEMAEEKISRLFDANYLQIKINDVGDLEGGLFIQKIHELDKKQHGRLFVKEFPTGLAGVSNIRSLLDDLKYRKDFVPKIIIVDYINLMKCDRYSDSNSYTLIKGIAEELRGLAVEGNYCVVTATQTNRDGAKSSDIDMTDTAESYGLPQTADLLIGLKSSDTLREKNLLIWKSLKNRLSGIVGRKFPVKTNFDFAQLLDCDPQDDSIISNDVKNQQQIEKERMKEKLLSKVNNSNKKNNLPQNVLEEELFG